MEKRARRSRTAGIFRGSGNVFADLGHPDAEERQTKLRLALALNTIVAERGSRRCRSRRKAWPQSAEGLGAAQLQARWIFRREVDGFAHRARSRCRDHRSQEAADTWRPYPTVVGVDLPYQPSSSKRSAPTRFDVGRLDDRPPLLDLRPLVGGERGRRLLVARHNLVAEIVEALARCGIRERRLRQRAGLEPAQRHDRDVTADAHRTATDGVCVNARPFRQWNRRQCGSRNDTGETGT